jgi:hypothetical protein
MPLRSLKGCGDILSQLQEPQFVEVHDPQPEPAELVYLYPLEWLNVDMILLTFFFLHVGQITSLSPKTRISKFFLHLLQ